MTVFETASAHVSTAPKHAIKYFSHLVSLFLLIRIGNVFLLPAWGTVPGFQS